MPTDLSKLLIVGVSTRALFDLEEENEVFNKAGIVGFRKFQLENEDKLLKPVTAQSLLELNKQAENQKI